MKDCERSSTDSSGDDSSSEPENSQQSLQAEVEDSISQLLDLSVLLRKQGAQQHEDRAAQFVPVDENGESMLDEYAEWSQRACQKSMENADGFLPETWMVSRMQRTILRRWRLMCYRVHHANRVAASRIIDLPFVEPGANITQAPVPSTPATEIPLRVNARDDRTVITVRTKQSSAASELPADFMLPTPTKRPRSSASSKTRFMPGKHDFPAPPRAEVESREFSCPYCRLPQPAKDLKRSRWQ
jgi:hypothetical protein